MPDSRHPARVWRRELRPADGDRGIDPPQDRPGALWWRCARLRPRWRAGDYRGAARAGRFRRRHLDGLDLAGLHADLERLYEIGEFEQVAFTLAEVEGRRGLIIRAREKSWGPRYLRFGLNYASDMQGRSSFNFLGSLTWGSLNARGAEWRTDLQLGRAAGVTTELYQPFDFSGFTFVAPRAEYTSVFTDVYNSAGHRTGEYRVRSARAGLDLGLQLSKYGELRAGLVRGRSRAVVDVGMVELPATSFRVAGARTRLVFDRLDSASFPRHGGYTEIELFLSRTSLGAEASYERLVAGWDRYWTRRRNVFFVNSNGGSSLNSTLPFFEEFPLGGLFSLSGYHEGELRGQHYAVLRAGYYRQVSALPGAVGSGVFLGGWAEAGNVWARRGDIGLDGLKTSLTIALGADTALGPLYLAVGSAGSRHTRTYLSLGRTF
ncbi:MAG: BamA/TamA family outer membrane protein [Acidobacteriota bacterium]